LTEPVDTVEYQRNPPSRPTKKILRNLCMLFFNSALAVNETFDMFFLREGHVEGLFFRFGAGDKQRSCFSYGRSDKERRCLQWYGIL
jgi:hypothetical protein